MDCLDCSILGVASLYNTRYIQQCCPYLLPRPFCFFPFTAAHFPPTHVPEWGRPQLSEGRLLLYNMISRIIFFFALIPSMRIVSFCLLFNFHTVCNVVMLIQVLFYLFIQNNTES